MNNYFLQYYDKVKSGEILVGKELMKTLDNLFKDLANPRYFFDLRPGSIRIDFIHRNRLLYRPGNCIPTSGSAGRCVFIQPHERSPFVSRVCA